MRDLDNCTKKLHATVIDLKDKSEKRIEQNLAVEEPLEIYVNGQLAATIFSTPVMQREQVYGYLLDEGIISNVEQIESMDLREGRVRVRLSFDPSLKLMAANTYKVITTACGLWNPEFARLLDRIDKPYVRSNYALKANELFRMLDDFNQRPEIWKATGATHSAGLYEEGRLVGYGEDVGRHNAVDKAIGQAAQVKANFGKCVAFSTGRQPADMILKAARVGVPILVSSTSVIYSGVYAARKTNVTLAGLARESSLRIYAGKERILMD